MATVPGGTPPGDDALDHVVKNLFDVELEKLAFGRPRTEAERQRAAAAARELARRAAQHRSRAGEPARVEPDLAPVDSAPRPAAVAEPAARPWWSRTAVVVAASILTLVAATTVAPALWTGVGDSPSLDVFAREATTEEIDLRAQLLREGLRVSVTPRIIAETGDARFVAYRVIVATTAERPRSEVCLLLADEEGIGWPSCTDRTDFARGGIQTTLSGPSARYVVVWGPVGAPRVSVLPDAGPAPARPGSAAALPFFAETPRQEDTAYARVLRTTHPDDRLLVRVLDSTEGWDAVGALVASVDTGLWSYCVHLFSRAEDPSAQLGASVTCAGREPFERDGLVAQAHGEQSSLRLEWQPDGTVLMQEFRAP